MKMKTMHKGIFLVFTVAASLFFSSCNFLQNAVETAMKETTAPFETPSTSPMEVTATETAKAESTPMMEEDAPQALFENEYVRIYFTEFSGAEGTLSFRVVNLTRNAILFLTPFDMSGDVTAAEGCLMVDGEPHLALPNSTQTAPVGGFCAYRITTATGPDKEGYYNIKPLSTNAKIAEFNMEFYICDENRSVLSTIKLPPIDLAVTAFFPLPSATDFTTKTLDGKEINGTYFTTHKLTMVNFWATWCGPCINEMPDISALHTEYSEQGFAVLGVLVWDEGNEAGALNFLTSSEISYPVVAYNTIPLFTEIASTQQAIPFTIFFDTMGEQVGDVVVGSRSKAEWATVVDELLLQVG